MDTRDAAAERLHVEMPGRRWEPPDHTPPRSRRVGYPIPPEHVEAVRAGRRRHWIGPQRHSPHFHARPGDIVEPYVRGQRRRVLIEAACVWTELVTIDFRSPVALSVRLISEAPVICDTPEMLQQFAELEGFATTAELVRHWAVARRMPLFSGVIVHWGRRMRPGSASRE